MNIKYTRFDTAQYFTDILHCLFNDLPITTTLKIEDGIFAKKIQVARNYIEDLYKEFQDELRYNN